VAAIAGLLLYELRHHLVAGLVVVIVVCLVGIGGITLMERRIAKRKRSSLAGAQPVGDLNTFGPGGGSLVVAHGAGRALIGLDPGQSAVVSGAHAVEPQTDEGANQDDAPVRDSLPGESLGPDVVGIGSRSAESLLAESKSVPSFFLERAEFDRIDRDYNEADAANWEPVIDQWIEDVRAKLHQWNPRQAERFMAPSVTTAALGSISQLMGRPDVARDPNLRRLHGYRNRLREIVNQ